MDKQPNTRSDPEKSGGDLSLEELFETFPDEKTATGWLESNMWPDGRKCPRCGYKHACMAKHPEMPYYCAECNMRFSARAGTVMEHSRISYRRWAVATYLQATRPKRISSVHLGRDLGIRQCSARFLLHRLREAWRTIAGPEPMSAPSRRTSHIWAGAKRASTPTRRARGKRRPSWASGTGRQELPGQSPFRRLPRPAWPSLSSRTLQRMPGAFTGKSGPYNSLGNHETVNHGDGEYVRGKVRINGILPRSGRMESFWATVRRGYNGAFRRIGPKHLHRYVNEFAGRLGMRALGAVDKMRAIVQNLVGKRLTYEQLVAAGAPCGRP